MERAVREISNFVRIPSRNAVYEYLGEFPDLVDAVVPICEEMRRQFPLPVGLSLEVYQDPEIDERYLALYIRAENYGREFLDRIEAAGEKSLTPVTHGGRLDITTDFQPPGGMSIFSVG
ncbi:MAG TPA: hypothetical protein VG269_15350 [Tepidisphaeraceae bacterium]|jgi:hypothetical protein|nr:hypothetical protein [Tepidisphaeraceae bacterium]